jgi:hypothetical protein
VRLAASASALLSGTADASLNVTASGTYLTRQAMLTGAANLSAVGTTASTCSDWTVSTGSATTGQTTVTAPFWGSTFMVNCSSTTPFYCLEQ